MPSGKVHDQITVITAALSWPVWHMVSPAQDTLAYLAGVGAYLFSGFYLSDDLDTRCVALKRWGPLAALWAPYRKLVPHRSWVSHGIGVGPILRVVYFLALLWALARSVLWLINKWLLPVDRNLVLKNVAVWIATVIRHHPVWFEWALGGLILGGVAHALADTTAGALKKLW